MQTDDKQSSIDPHYGALPLPAVKNP